MTHAELARELQERCARYGVAPEDLEWGPEGLPTKASIAKLRAALDRRERTRNGGVVPAFLMAAGAGVYELVVLVVRHPVGGAILLGAAAVAGVAVAIRGRRRSREFANIPVIVDGQLVWRRQVSDRR